MWDVLGDWMDTKVEVHSREAIRHYTDNEDHLVISVTDPESAPATLPDNAKCLGVLRLQFHDVDRPHEGRDYALFNEAHAHQIIGFIRPHLGKVKHFHVNCEAGISRSSAIAAFISRVVNHDDGWYFKRYLPNRRVYSMLYTEYFKVK